ncbi:hypothetical protein [Cetobacterium sp.]|uniref:hypothetical protein n=1 Tax=Cetobacterium sp. TaxID=2071632 RepID=UPI003F2F8A2E
MKKLTFYSVLGGISINIFKRILATFLVLGAAAFSKEITNKAITSTEEINITEVVEDTINIENEVISKPELRLIGSFYTVHMNDNDVYNNNTNLIGFEYRPIKDVGVSLGYFKNSFDNDSYVLAVAKYFRPINKLNNFYLNLGVGVVKGYRRENYIYDSSTGEVLKKSKFNTNIGSDYIVGANVGLGYDITDYLSLNVSYVGAFVSAVSLKLY